MARWVFHAIDADRVHTRRAWSANSGASVGAMPAMPPLPHRRIRRGFHPRPLERVNHASYIASWLEVRPTSARSPTPPAGAKRLGPR